MRLTLRLKRSAPSSTRPAGIFLAAAIILTQIGDALSTIIGIELGAVETNSLMARAVEYYSYPGFFLLKTAAGIFLSWALWRRPTGSAIIIALFLALILNNLLVISRLLT